MRQGQAFVQLLLLLLTGLCPICLALPQSLGASTSRIHKPEKPDPRPLRGKFLHITDIHPDPYYKTHSSTAEGHACHRGRGSAGVYGAETSDCDTPISLLNATFKWINDTIKNDIDFIVWTGDSARHDNDEKIPRSQEQVVHQNRFVVQKFLEVFGKPENYDDPDPTNDFILPIIPTLGNNDILPHNIFTEGPNKWTKAYLDIWRQFIPEAQRHQFQRGGWFFVEVIPNKLAVFSLNTLYFFDSNSAVDGCASKSEPGHEQFEWLRIQLEILRERGMKAMLTGHVPPARVDSKVSWDETCWQKYALWLRQYRDVIVGSFYGHMNIDHFMLQDFKDIKKHVKNGLAMTSTHNKTRSDQEITTESAGDYLVDLRDTFAKIPSVNGELSTNEDEPSDNSWMDYLHSILGGHDHYKVSIAEKKDGKKQGPLNKIGGEYGERYSLSFVQASIIPNYFPTLRVFEYNITGLENMVMPGSQFEHQRPQHLQKPVRQPQIVLSGNEGLSGEPVVPESDVIPKKKKEHEERKKPKRHKFKVPSAPSKSSPPGPAYSPQTLTLLGYKQYYANLSYINNDFHGDGPTNSEDLIDTDKWKEGHHKGKVKKGKPKPKTFKFHVEYDTLNDKIYGLKDLTVRSYLDLAKRISASKSGGKSLEMEDSQVHCGDEPDIHEVADSEDDQDEDDSDEDMNTEKAKDKKKKKKHKKKSHNKVWYAFVERAFVGTLGVSDIEDQFG